MEPKYGRLVVCGRVGALMVCRELMEFAYGRISGRDGILSIILLLLRWGAGSCIKFWFDTWCEGTPLKDIFP